MPSHIPEVRGSGLAVAIGFLETGQVVAQGGAAVLFAAVVVRTSYTWGWVLFGLLAIATLPALGAVVPNWARRPMARS